MDTNSCSSINESTSSSAPTPPPAKATRDRLRRLGSGDSVVLDPPDPGSAEAESRKLPSSQYKGVVPQPNGRWGAQIYEKHQRVWLGTFNEESEAARAYDVAAQKFRGRDAATNFKHLSNNSESDAVVELFFLNSRSKAEVVDMLRKHTYADELQQSRRCQMRGSTERDDDDDDRSGRRGHAGAPGWWLAAARESLFEKAVTPSDVGKLNRLVIPKQNAEKHLPLQIGGSVAAKGVLLNFEDAGGKVWRFRYSYWNSSQSYVLTKGWSRFVKEKGLRAGDVVSFMRSTSGQENRQLFIDWRPRMEVVVSGGAGAGTGGGGGYSCTFPVQTVRQPVQTTVRLFGVDIVKVGGGWEGKRKGEWVEGQVGKKQCLRASQ